MPLASNGIVAIKNRTALAVGAFPNGTGMGERFGEKKHRSSGAFVRIPYRTVFIVG